MPDTFFNYLQNERSRLDQELEQAVSRGSESDHVALLDRLRRVVDDQLARWAIDLNVDRLTV